MKKHLLNLFTVILLINSSSYGQDAKELHETAKAFMRQGDYSNSILVLNKASQLAPSDILIKKDLSLSYYFQNEHAKALEVIAPVADSDNADDQAFQIAANINKSLNQPKEAERLYKKGLKKFPESGGLYNDLGELQWSQQDYEAIKTWEKGIQQDPSYSKNYFNASRYYYLTGNSLWSLLYGEMFLNMEPFSASSPEIKDILLESYKKLFTEKAFETTKESNSFTRSYLKLMGKQEALTTSGLNAETLSMIRTRFILEWFSQNNPPAFKLFEYHRQLLQDGLFEAYNQWIFGSAQNLPYFQSWINSHPDEYSAFTSFQKSRIFKVPEGQYYHEK